LRLLSESFSAGSPLPSTAPITLKQVCELFKIANVEYLAEGKVLDMEQAIRTGEVQVREQKFINKTSWPMKKFG
jgi:hypothetical protein